VQEVAPSADGELNDPAQTFFLSHTDILTSSTEEGEEEEKGFGLESNNNLKAPLTEEESTADITKLVSLNGIEGEVSSGLKEEVADVRFEPVMAAIKVFL